MEFHWLVVNGISMLGRVARVRKVRTDRYEYDVQTENMSVVGYRPTADEARQSCESAIVDELQRLKQRVPLPEKDIADVIARCLAPSPKTS